MKNNIEHESSFFKKRKEILKWAPRPSGLGYWDFSALYYLGKICEEKAIEISRPVWSLDLGTFFGHSSFSLLQGSNVISNEPNHKILSIDIFEQPDYVLKRSNVQSFIKKYGGVDKENINNSLISLLELENMTTDNINLYKIDLLKLEDNELIKFSKDGYFLNVVDCGKSPELINKIGLIINNPIVTQKNSIIFFQDFYDWHTPFNLFLAYKLFEKENIELIPMYRVGPLGIVKNFNKINNICDQIEDINKEQDNWVQKFTSYENEIKAYEFFKNFHKNSIYHNQRLEVFKISILLRHGDIIKAEKLLYELDKNWLPTLEDLPLIEAYRRFNHIKTGTKDLSLIMDTEFRKRRNEYFAKKKRYFNRLVSYFYPI